RHMFQRHFKMTAKEYISKKRLEYAKDLLIRTEYPINEIAKLSGFNSPAYFTKTFREIHDITPKDFRLQLEKKDINESEIIVLDNKKILFIDPKDKNIGGK